MCGIACFVGKNAPKNCYNALKKLDYRGYDSAGVAVLKKGIKIYKRKGEVENIKDFCFENDSQFAIAHTRWATHGEASEINAHPHLSFSKEFAMVHNGIIENYKALESELEKRGIKSVSETDTEVMLNSLAADSGSLLERVARLKKRVEGSFAIAVLSAHKEVALARRSCPLYIGRVREGFIAASDTSCLADEYYPLKEGEIAILTKDNIELFNDRLEKIEINFVRLEKGNHAAELNGYPHHMLKEIHEIKEVATRLERMDNAPLDEALKYFDVKNIFLIGCGTAFHAAEIGARILEEKTSIACYSFVASEFKYQEKVLDGALGIFISQSGETADTIGCLNIFKRAGLRTLAIVSNTASTLARQADCFLSTQSFVEVAVASTKAYVAQILVLAKLASRFKKEEFSLAPFIENVEKFMQIDEQIVSLTQAAQRVFFIGRGLGSVTASEAALKLKEITYKTAEGYPAGELKHGTIALIENNTPVVVFSLSERLHEKTMSSLKEARSRGATIILVSPFEGECDHKIQLPPMSETLLSALAIIPFQVLAYEVALRLGNNPDKPRNLAKSVTVE